MVESCQTLGTPTPPTVGRGRTYGTFDSQSVEQDGDAEFGFYDDGDIEGSFEGEFFSGENADGSFENVDSGENEASFY